MRSRWDSNLQNSVVVSCPAPYRLSCDDKNYMYILFKLMDDGFVCMYVCIRVVCHFFVLFESNLIVPVNIFSLLTELRCCLSYVKQT